MQLAKAIGAFSYVAKLVFITIGPASHPRPIRNFTVKPIHVDKLHTIIRFLENLAPPSLQESYDNSGLIVGNPDWEINGALISLDSTEEVVDEAIRQGCNLIIAHHPIVFSGLKRFNGKNYVERTIIKAIKNDIAIYAIHTNLDNVATGVNAEICSRLGLTYTKILDPRKGQIKKLVTYCPIPDADKVRDALFAAGAGHIGNYDECSFNTQGVGTFRPTDGAKPVIGEIGLRHIGDEIRIETIFPQSIEKQVLAALFKAHPFEEVAYELFITDNQHQNIGSGMVGNLPTPMDTLDFMMLVKENFGVKTLRHTTIVKNSISRVAVCGGSGSFLLSQAIASGADVFVTADFKYHQFFDAEGKIIILDIGHFESEQFTKDLLYRELSAKFTTFALRLSGIDTNPVKYF
jgi:dinuclear metal center YbgI/SA1388 family protein